MEFKREISIRDLQNGNIESWVDFSQWYSFERVQRQFEKIGIVIDDREDLDAIVRLHNTGGDIAGDLKNAEGQSIRFNALSLLKSIPLDKRQMLDRFAGTEDFTVIKKGFKNSIR
jgi:hypothetical protein